MRNKNLLKRLLQIVLLAPAVFIAFEFFAENQTKEMYDHALKETGEIGTRLIIVTLLISPLLLIFKKLKVLKWMAVNKRYFGVASAVYMLLHTLIYVVYLNFDQIVTDLSQATYVFGWLALLAVLPPLLTSWDSQIKRLGSKTWKRVQQISYVCAVFTCLHWAFLGDEIEVVLLHFVPLLVLEIYRINKTKYKPQHAMSR